MKKDEKIKSLLRQVANYILKTRGDVKKGYYSWNYYGDPFIKYKTKKEENKFISSNEFIIVFKKIQRMAKLKQLEIKYPIAMINKLNK